MTDQHDKTTNKEYEAALRRIVALTIEWDSNKLGPIDLQRKRWKFLGGIARDALLDITPTQPQQEAAHD